MQKRETFNPVNLWLRLYKQGKNESEWKEEWKAFF